MNLQKEMILIIIALSALLALIYVVSIHNITEKKNPKANALQYQRKRLLHKQHVMGDYVSPLLVDLNKH